LFTQSSTVHELLLQVFPYPSTLGEVTLHLLSQASMFVYSACGKWVFPLLLCSFSFFPGWGSVCPGGYANLAQGCLWEYHVPFSSPCGLCLPKPSGCGWLLAVQGPSWFLCSMWSGDALRRLEVWRGSKFFLFSVALTARCVSCISPRFHFRRHAFCFLPLATILENLPSFLLLSLLLPFLTFNFIVYSALCLPLSFLWLLII
jgi:hypothetical protein